MKYWRTSIGAFFVTLGIGIGLLGIINHKVLWAGVKEKEKIVYKTQIEHSLAIDNQTYVSLHEVTVEYRYEWSTNHIATGDYQFRDKNNVITVVKFCSPAPELKRDAIITVDYKVDDHKTGCDIFLDAKILKEAE